MKFFKLRDFEYKPTTSLKDIGVYLTRDLLAGLRELSVGLGFLTFEENFTSFVEELTILAGQELPIRNRLRAATPTKWLRVRCNEAGLSVCDGGTQWSTDFIYLKNTHPTDTATLTVVFLR